MKLNTFLKSQLEDFVNVYSKYFFRTMGITLILTLICFVVIALLEKFSDFDPSIKLKQISLLSYFFSRYSKGDTYSLIDLSKTVFIFFVSIFSLSLCRLSQDKKDNSELKILAFLKRIHYKDYFILIGILLISSLFDFLMFRIERISHLNVSNNELYYYIHGIIFLLRIYLPLILFGITIYRLIKGKAFKLTFRKLLFIFISLWLFNEFAFEFSLVIRNYVFGLILLPFKIENYFLFESILGIGLVAFYFLGYYSALTTSIELLDDKK
jgi:hypothetical protein